MRGDSQKSLDTQLKCMHSSSVQDTKASTVDLGQDTTIVTFHVRTVVTIQSLTKLSINSLI